MPRSPKGRSEPAQNPSRGRRSPGRPREDVETVGREQLIRIARELLREVPPSAVNRIEVARRAGVDPGLIRYYFGTVQALMREVTMEIWEDISVRTKRATAGMKNPEEKIRARVTVLMQTMGENPHFHALMLEHVLLPTGSVKPDVQAEYYAARVDEMRGFVEEGVQAGIFHDMDPRYLFMSMVGMCQFYYESGMRLKDILFKGEPPEDVKQRYTDFVADLILAGLRRAHASRAK
jgi:AcrR family transcriptional regulator